MKTDKRDEISSMASILGIAIGGFLLIFALVIGYAYAVQKYNEEAPVKTSIVTQKRY